jgi:chitodextrinase
VTAEQARQLRKLLENQTATMTDEQILNYPDFVEKWRPNKKYEKDKRLEYNGVIYKAITTHTSQSDWTPDTSHSLYTKVLIPDENVIPEWEQPDSTNAYSEGDKVTHNGKTWQSTVNNNVWEPGVYGWNEVVI